MNPDALFVKACSNYINGIEQYLADAMSYVASIIGHILDSVRAPVWSADAIKCLRFKTLL